MFCYINSINLLYYCCFNWITVESKPLIQKQLSQKCTMPDFVHTEFMLLKVWNNSLFYLSLFTVRQNWAFLSFQSPSQHPLTQCQINYISLLSVMSWLLFSLRSNRKDQNDNMKLVMLHKKLLPSKWNLQIRVFLVFRSARWKNTESLEQWWKIFPEADLGTLQHLSSLWRFTKQFHHRFCQGPKLTQLLVTFPKLAFAHLYILFTCRFIYVTLYFCHISFVSCS